MKKCLVAFVIFSLLLSIPVLADYKGKSLSQIKTLMNSTLKLFRDELPFVPYTKAKILKIVKNQSGKVDFYAQILIRREVDEHSFAMTVGVVMSVVTGCTRQVSWSSDKLYFCPANTDKPNYWISTSMADAICRMNSSPLADTWDDRILAKVILRELHKVKKGKKEAT
jgi:hypothetical protein